MQVPYLERKFLILFLILIDAQSKWIEAFCIASATLATTMGCLHQGLEQFGIPEMVVTGNVTCFTSKEFKFHRSKWRSSSDFDTVLPSFQLTCRIFHPNLEARVEEGHTRYSDYMSTQSVV